MNVPHKYEFRRAEFKAGFLAYHAGAENKDCPFPHAGPLREYWFEGHNAARFDKEDAARALTRR